MTAPAATTVRRRIRVRGVVQGVGFRPFVHRLATEQNLTGFVTNDAGGVVVEVEGPPTGVERFCTRLTRETPALAAVSGVDCADIPVTKAADGFAIRPSEGGRGRTVLPPDTATCTSCLRELADPADRRHRHPFITCTHCGPRYTITTALPYDRVTTTMAVFPMCTACTEEYRDPRDRRFHAQPVACRDCGPRLRLLAPGIAPRPARDEAALTQARALLADGRIVAVKGVGGYHLACDACDPRAVARLRARKRRLGKPFAVMARDMAAAAEIAEIGDAERVALLGPRRPIVLLRRRQGPLASEVCGASPYVGVMLPYTPVHTLLLGLPQDPPGPRVLVMTSGNRSGEPIVTDDAEAQSRLEGIADAWLTHDRGIVSPCDDSVLRIRADGTTQVLRRSRGYVPQPLALPFPVPPTLAVGGDLKNAPCLGADDEAWFGPHLGDLGALATLDALERADRHLRQLTGVRPGVVAADLHPGYHSAQWAHRRAGGRGPALVQHHHAHVASALAEHRLGPTARLIGIAFDGTGYGDDGTVWGGEVLLAGYAGYRRYAHLAPAPLPGGDAGVANPCRLALARLHAAGLPWAPEVPSTRACSQAELSVLACQLERDLACVPTSSMGRLFDAVSSLAGVCHRVSYEAQAALELEAEATRAWNDETGAYAFGFRQGSPVLLDPSPVLRALLTDLRRGTPRPVLAVRFHRGVAAAVSEICRRARRDTGLSTVALTGGVFANALLEEACTRLLTADGFTVLRHGEVPAGDGGLALGQLMVAAGRHPEKRGRT
ncbi:carbamoyltransferase HypF [Streptomyces albus]